MRWISKTITNENMLIRFASLWMLGLAILLIVWSFSYTSLPEGSAEVTTTISVVKYVPLTTGEVNSTFIRLFLYNTLVTMLVIFLASLVKVKGYSLGYIIVLYHWAFYGLFLGTNSFLTPAATKLIPSLVTLFKGSGIYEITSYTMVATAAFRVGIPIERLSLEVERRWLISKLKKHGFSWIEILTIVLAVLLLAIANYLEAWQIFHQ